MMIELLAAFMLAGSAVAEARLPAGTVIEATHVSGDKDAVDAIVGQQLTRTMHPGRIIGPGDVKAPDLVGRNDLVRIIARKGPLRVETRGRALGAGAAGADVIVMNLESRRTVQGRVIGPNLVEVDL